MNSKIFLSIFLAILAAGVFLYWLFRWQKHQEEALREEQAERDLKRLQAREIGFAAILKERTAPSNANG